MIKIGDTSYNTCYTAYFAHPNPDFVGTSYSPKPLYEMSPLNLKGDWL